MRQKVSCFCLLAALGGAGCGSNAAGPATSTEGADFVSCAAETRATPYSAGMSETSRSGQSIIKLLKNTFVLNGKTLTEAPTKGADTWYVEVDDAASGQPGDITVANVSPWMPDHQHGTTPVGVTATGTNTLTLDPMNFYMAGYWEVTVNLGAAIGGTVADSAMFPICVPD